ncbi:MAG: hypothetical protein M0R76_04485 [Proteobacteria bacterium]|nr:hypothetical protein [Pseudomonadota bacterium]
MSLNAIEQPLGHTGLVSMSMMRRHAVWVQYLLCLPLFLFLAVACDSEDAASGTPTDDATDNNKPGDPDYGNVIFKGVKAFSDGTGGALAVGSNAEDGAVVAPAIHKMYTAEFHANVAEIWLSLETVTDGLEDDLEWILVDTSPNELKPLYDYEIQNEKMPAGVYRSMKLVFRNEMLQVVLGYDDPSLKIEMHTGIDGGATPNNAEEVVECFSSGGSYNMTEHGNFHLMSSGETLRPLHLAAGKTSIVEWIVGAPGMDPKAITFDWDDHNDNGVWDEGDNDSNYQTDPKYDGVDIPMFSFNVVSF